MRVQSTKNYGLDSLKFVIYGPPGVGKTSLAATTGGRVCVISAEGGLLSLSGKEIDFIDLTRDDDGSLLPKEERFDRLSAAYKYLASAKAREKYSTIFLDSLTEIGQNLVEKLKLKHENLDKKDGFALWGEYADSMRAMIKAFRDLPKYHVIFTALETTDKDEVGRRFANVDLQGKIATQLPGYVDFVFKMHSFDDESGVRRRVLITGGSDKVIAKDRSGKLEQIEEPNLFNIYKKVTGQAAKGDTNVI